MLATRETPDVAAKAFHDIRKFADEIRGSADLEELPLAPVFAAVIASSDRLETIVPNALELRNKTRTQALRKALIRLETSLAAGEGGISMAKFRKDIGEMLEDLRRELGLAREHVESHVWLFKVPVRVPSVLFKTAYVGKKAHLAFSKDITRLSIESSRIGEHMRKLLDKAPAPPPRY